MADGTHEDKDNRALFKVLKSHYRTLVSARSDKIILRQYASLLRFLKSNPADVLDERAKARRSARSRPTPTITEEELHKASLDDLEKIVTDTKTARKDLEFIAIQRFSVPHGSMRAFAGRQMLVDKLRTLIRNERAHESIGA